MEPQSPHLSCARSAHAMVSPFRSIDWHQMKVNLARRATVRQNTRNAHAVGDLYGHRFQKAGVIVKAMAIARKRPTATVMTTATTGSRSHRKMSSPMRNMTSASSKRAGMEEIVALTCQPFHASNRIWRMRMLSRGVPRGYMRMEAGGGGLGVSPILPLVHGHPSLKERSEHDGARRS